MIDISKTTLLLVFVLVVGGCGAKPKQAPGRPPTPESISKANPGGDADDPELAALRRLIEEPWGHQRDKWGTLRVPLADGKNWRRVRIWGQPTRATFRYGDKHYALVTVWYTPIEGINDPEACMARFLDQAQSLADSFGVRTSEPQIVRMNQAIDGEVHPVLVQLMDGSVEGLTGNNEYVGVIAAYQSWPATCLVQGVAIKAGRHRQMAIKVRDRWLADGVTQLRWESKVKEAPPPHAR